MSFIEDAIEKAIKRINQQVALELSPRIDRDVKDVPGTPAIADTILKKIRASGMVVADVTLVGTSDCEVTLMGRDQGLLQEPLLDAILGAEAHECEAPV